MSYSSEVLADSPLVYARLNETSGTVVVDSSGNGRDGGYGAGTMPTQGVTGLLTGDSDKAVGLTANASTNYGPLWADAAWMDVSAISVECWVNLTSSLDAGSGDGLVTRYSAANSWLLWRDGAGKLAARVRNSINTAFNVAAPTAASLNTTYHVVFTMDGSSLKLYVNGSQVGSTVTFTGTLAANSLPIQIGQYGGIQSTVPGGTIDEVAIYDHALTSTRIAAHYTAGTTAPAITGTLAATLPKPTLAFTGSYTPPPQTGTFAATLPLPTPAFTGSYQAPPTGTFAATLTVPTVSFTGSYTAPPNPTGSLDAALPVPTVDFAGGYTPPPETGTFDVSLPVPVPDFTGTYTPAPISGSFDVTLPVPVADFTGDTGAVNGTLAAVLPLPTLRFFGDYGGPYPTDTSNDANGRQRLGSATVTITRPVAAPPASLTLALKYDKAVALPTPTMVNGRPT